MPNAVKVAISLPSAILQTIEAERRKRGESRSEFFRQAVQSFLRELKERRDVERYVQGYLEQPETAEEVREVSAVSYGALAEEPWE